MKVLWKYSLVGSASAQCFMSVDPLADHPEQVAKSVYAYSWNDPISMMDEDGEFPIKGVITTARYAWRVYKIYKAVGRITAEGLKKAGIDELKGMADDFQTIFSSNASVSDRIGAAVDLMVGTELNGTTQSIEKPAESDLSAQSKVEAKDKTKENRRNTNEHVSNARGKTRNKHETAQSRKLKEQAAADKKYSKTKSTKDTRSNNQKKKDNTNYKRTGLKNK